MSNTTAPKSPKPSRKSPLQSAIATAERAVTRMERRKTRSLNRAERYKVKIAECVEKSATFNGLILALRQNVDSLRKMESSSK